jgi:hypothetical protein
MFAEHGEMPPRFAGVIEGKHLASMLFVGIIALLAVNFLNLHELSEAISGGFLVVYAAVNLANVKLGSETNSWRWLSLLAALVCIIALVITLYDFAANPQTRLSAGAIVAIVVLPVATEKAFRTIWPDPRSWGKCNHGKALTQNSLARRLNPFGVRTGKVGPEAKRAAGTRSNPLPIPSPAIFRGFQPYIGAGA